MISSSARACLASVRLKSRKSDMRLAWLSRGTSSICASRESSVRCWRIRLPNGSFPDAPRIIPLAFASSVGSKRPSNIPPATPITRVPYPLVELPEPSCAVAILTSRQPAPRAADSARLSATVAFCGRPRSWTISSIHTRNCSCPFQRLIDSEKALRDASGPRKRQSLLAAVKHHRRELLSACLMRTPGAIERTFVVTKHLTDSLNLLQLKHQAKDFLKLLEAGDPDAIARFERQRDAPRPEYRLSDAQLTIAREYGFSSWPRLKAHIEEIQRIQQRRPTTASLWLR